MPSSKRTQAIVLRRTDYAEADRIVQCITPEGKISVLARGVRRPKSKLAGGIELLSLSDITYISGKSELATLTSARANTFFRHVIEDYERLQFAYEILRDIAKVSEHLDESDFFAITRQTLDSLNRPEIELGLSELYYRLHVAALLGDDANLVRDTEGNPLDETQHYRFDTMCRAFVSDAKGHYSSDHIKLLRLASVQPPRIVAQVRRVEALLDECLIVARAIHD